MSKPSSRIELDGIAKRFGDNSVLHDLNLSIEPGEFVVLLGPSGCGKSTLLRLIAGLEEPSAGRIRIGPRDVTDFPPRRRDVAMVFQSYALYAHLSVADNISFPLRMRDLPWYYEIPVLGRLMPAARERKRAHREQAGKAAEAVGMQHLLHRKPRELSGGQRQRVALARAMIHDPSVFLMDEPLSNLDAQLRSHTRAEIIRLHQRLKRTFVYVTHDQVEAMTMGTRVIVMNQGRIQQDGTPDDLYDAPANAFVAGFVGSPAINLIPAQPAAEGFAVNGYVLPGSVQYRAAMGATQLPRSLTLGIRPEYLRIGEQGMPAQIELVERLGTEQVVTLQALGASLRVKLDSEVRYRAGDRVNVSLDWSRAHLFDAEGGGRIETCRGQTRPLKEKFA
ncbi:MAG: ABC transporter ATP-binding protein [Achromobacter sp.]|uniref:ABC transporter ATP-binding protein n=1 Tax=Achromobacter sp. TaxID=134375 RepID=UPI003D07F770